MYARFSADDGSTFKSGASDYGTSWFRFSASGTAYGGGAAAQMPLSSGGTVNVTGGGINGRLQWTDRAASGLAEWDAHYIASTPSLDRGLGQSNITFAGQVSAVLIGFVSVNVAAQGSLVLYGSVD